MTTREKLTKTKVAVVEYLATHDIVEKLNKTVNELAKARPADPFAFLADVLSDYRLHNDTPLIDRIQLRFTLPQSYSFAPSTLPTSSSSSSSSSMISSSILCSNSPCINATLFGRVSTTRAAREFSAVKWCHPQCIPSSLSVDDSSRKDDSKEKTSDEVHSSSTTTTTSSSSSSTSSMITAVDSSVFVSALMTDDPLQLTDSVTRLVLPALRRFRMHENKAIDLTLDQIYENHFEQSDQYRVNLKVPTVPFIAGAESTTAISDVSTSVSGTSSESATAVAPTIEESESTTTGASGLSSSSSDGSSSATTAVVTNRVRTPRNGLIRPLKLALFHLSLLVIKSAAQFMNLPLYQYILRYVTPAVKPPGLDGEDTPTISRARSLVASDSMNNRMPNLAMIVYESAILPTVFLIVNPSSVGNPLKILGMLQTASLVMKGVFESSEFSSGLTTLDGLFSALKIAMESLRATISSVNDEFGSMIDGDPVLFQYYLSFENVNYQPSRDLSGIMSSKKDWFTYLLDKVDLLNNTGGYASSTLSPPSSTVVSGTSAVSAVSPSGGLDAGMIAYIQDINGPLSSGKDDSIADGTGDDDLFLEMAEWSNKFRSKGVKLLAGVARELGGADIRSSDGLYGSVISVLNARTVSGLLCDAMIAHSQPCPGVSPAEENKLIVMDCSFDGFSIDSSVIDLSICMRSSLILMPNIHGSNNHIRSDGLTLKYDRWLELSATMDLADLSYSAGSQSSSATSGDRGTGTRLSVEQSTASETTVSDDTYLP